MKKKKGTENLWAGGQLWEAEYSCYWYFSLWKGEGHKIILEKILAEKFPNLMKIINHITKKLSELQAQETEEKHTKAHPKQISQTQW